MTRLFAQLTLPRDDTALNEHAVLLDEHRICLGRVFTLDRVLVPMSAAAFFAESALGDSLANCARRGRATAVIYYGEEAAGKGGAEFLYECGRVLFRSPNEARLRAFGFYRDRCVPLHTADTVARSPGGVLELLESAAPAHRMLACANRGRAHAVFRFEATAGTLTVFLVDGLPNQLRRPNRAYRLTTAVDDLATSIDRPDLVGRLRRTVAADPADPTVFVVVHCPLAAEHRYALADALLFAEEWKAEDEEWDAQSHSSAVAAGDETLCDMPQQLQEPSTARRLKAEPEPLDNGRRICSPSASCINNV